MEGQPVLRLEVFIPSELGALVLTKRKRSLNQEHLEAVVSVLECHAEGL